MKTILLLIIFLSIILFSCKKDEKRINAEKIVKEWVGKKIQFPSEYVCSILGKEIPSRYDLFDKEYKILLYTDSAGCTSCKTKLYEWKNILQESDSIFSKDQLSFLFFFHPRDKEELLYLLKRDRFRYPVFIDHNNQIDALNHFPKQTSYQCFLLDKSNRVVTIGNPATNPQIWTLYKQFISDKRKTPTMQFTTVKIK